MTTNTINKQNKADLGMNRNDFYEYKKNRIIDLVKKGGGVSEIAMDLGMGEKDVYAFLSRNFGGVRKLKEMVSAGGAIPQLQMASMTTTMEAPNAVNDQKRPVGRPKKVEEKPSIVVETFNNALSVEKDKILMEFKNSMEKDCQAIIAELQNSLDSVKNEMLSKFKNDIMTGLSEMAKAL